MGLNILANQVAKAGLEAPKLSYIPFPDEMSGSMPWTKHDWELPQSKKETTGRALLNGLVAPIVFTTLLVYSTIIWGFTRREVNATGSVINSTMQSASTGL